MVSPIRVLYAEDNSRDAELTRSFFAPLAPEFTLEIVGTGRSCLERLGGAAFDLLLLDYHLPDMDGSAVLKALLHEGARLPVVLVARVGDEELVVKVLRLGAATYVPKHEDYLATLPGLLRDVVAEHRRKLGPGSPAASAPRRILYVENLSVDIDLTLAHFAEAAPQFVVEVVRTCGAALERLAQPHAFDLALIDLRMPDQSGLDFVREAKRRRLQLPPFLMLSGKGDEEAALATLALGAADYIAKHEGYLKQLAYRIENAIAHDRSNRLNAQAQGEIAARTKVEENLRAHQIELEMQNEELRRVQTELDLARVRYFEIYDLAPVGYLTLSEAGLVLEANLAAATLLGLARGIRAKQPIFSRSIRKEDQDLFYRHRKRLVETGEPQAWEQRMVKSDGTVFWAHLAATAAREAAAVLGPAHEEGRAVGALVCRVVLSDISQRKLAEEALRATGWRMESIIEGTHVGTWEWNIQSGEVVFNEVWAQMAGYTLAELAPVSLGTWEALGHPDDLRRSSALLERHFAGELPDYDIECRMRHKDGHWVWVQDRGRVITRSADGKPLMMFGTHTDISERKRMEEEKAQLEEQNRQLQKAESLGLMAGAVAHNFNNLLQAVMMSLELVKGDVYRAESPEENLDLAMQSTRKAARVSGLMLTYLGQTHCKHELLDLSEVCRQSLPLLRGSLPQEVDLEADCPLPGPAVEANADQIQQILANLVVNGWEALGEGRGIVRVAVTIVAGAVIPAGNRRPLEFQPQGSGDYACVEVADSGGGIAEAEMDKLFDPFFTTKFTGRGLGLPVVLGILRAHDGAITVESTPGRGSSFRVFLPLAAQRVARAPVVVAPIQPALAVPDGFGAGAAPGAAVLVVEDEPVVRKAVGLALKRQGLAVLMAGDGVEAVEQLRQHPTGIQCVLCDVSLPGMDGWATMAALHQLEPGLPVILTSGYSEAQVMQGEHPERPHAFLNKPYEQAALIRAIRNALGQRKGASSESASG